MIKENILDSLREIEEILNDYEFKEATKEQKKMLRNNFNKSFNFEYCTIQYAFLMSESSFKLFEYYMGMEYEKEYIETVWGVGYRWIG